MRVARPLAVLAVAAAVFGWAVAQYPVLLPPRLTIAAAAAPAGTEATELVVVGIIVVLVIPSFSVLFRLAHSGRLGEAEVTSESLLARGDRPPGSPAGLPSPGGTAVIQPPRPSRLTAAIVVAMVAVEKLRRLRHASACRSRAFR